MTLLEAADICRRIGKGRVRQKPMDDLKAGDFLLKAADAIEKADAESARLQKIVIAAKTLREELRGGKSGVEIQAPAKKMIKILDAFGNFDTAVREAE